MNKYAIEMHKYTKKSRQLALRDVLSSRRIGDQAELRTALRKRGFPATQATISRDIRELGVVKAQVGPGRFSYQPPAPGAAAPPSLEAARKRLALLFRDFVTGVDGASHLIVVKTTPGNASGVASLIDGFRRPGILGTVAGDDTILIVADTELRRTEFERELRALLQGT
jgi:transcriptional regulator of arginine metabolism